MGTLTSVDADAGNVPNTCRRITGRIGPLTCRSHLADGIARVIIRTSVAGTRLEGDHATVGHAWYGQVLGTQCVRACARNAPMRIDVLKGGGTEGCTDRIRRASAFAYMRLADARTRFSQRSSNVLDASMGGPVNVSVDRACIGYASKRGEGNGRRRCRQRERRDDVDVIKPRTGAI